MVNYSNGKIYKIEPIVEHEEGDIYIGSTTKQYLSQRMDKHRGDYKLWKDGKKGKYMSFDLFDKYGIENCDIVLLECVNANTKDELHTREAYYIKSLKCVNKNIPNRTLKEWYVDNKEQMKQYYNDNKNKILDYKKAYYQDNIDKIKDYYQDNKEHFKERKKQHYQDNKDTIKEQTKQYYNDNKEKIKEHAKQYREEKKAIINQKANEKVLCQCCNVFYSYSGKTMHIRSKKHIENKNLKQI